MSYEKFVQLLDTEDAVAQKAIDIIVQDVFTRARSRKQAIEEARQSRQPTYSAIAAAAAARRDQVGEQARRAWHGEVPSLSQRLHGWRYLNAEDPNRQHQHTSPRDDAAEYDAIIADAQRQVASPLPMLGLVPAQQDNREDNLEPLFDSVDWPDLNSGAGAYGRESTSGWSDSGSDYEDDFRVESVERALSAIRTQRDYSRTNLTRLSTITAGSNVPNTNASRLRILQRLEQRRRDLMDRAEQQRNANNGNRSYPSYFNTSFSRTATENVDNGPSFNPQSPSDTIPIIVGGDFSNLPSTSNGSQPEGSETIRANYGPLQRNNSIRRSGFHSNRSQQTSPPNVTAATGAANALLPRTTQRPLQPRSPMSITRPINEPSDADFFARRQANRAQRQQLDTLFGRQGSDMSMDHEIASQSHEVGSFEDFSRASRQASRLTREDESENHSRDGQSTVPGSHNVNLPRFLLSPSSDPMLGASPVDGDAVNELLGSSSSVAGLGSMHAGSSSSRAPFITQEGRRSIVPPRAPILSRRSFPLDGSVPSPAFTTTRSPDNSTVRDTPAAVSEDSSAGQQPQRASSVPERGQLYRREEILSLAQFLDDDSFQMLRNNES